MVFTRKYDCVVVGAGPGGLIAAIYLRRFRRNILLVNSGVSRASLIPKVHNLVYKGKVSGKKLLRTLNGEVLKLATEMQIGEAKIQKARNGFAISIESKASGEKIFTKTVFARKVILATGLEDIDPPLSNLKTLARDGLVGYCPICDGFDHLDEPIAILVQDARAIKKVKFIATYSRRLHLILLKKISKQALSRLKRVSPNVRIHFAEVDSFRATKKKSLLIHFKKGKSLIVRLAYVALGAKVRDEAFRNLKNLRRTKDGFLITNSHQETSIKGLYAVGDCAHSLAQISVAIGQAAIAATDVHNNL